MIAFEGSAYCERHEYDAHKEARVMPDNLAMDEIYILMLAIRSRKRDQQAAKMPSQVFDITTGENGLHEVHFAILDDDGHADFNEEIIFVDGFWQDTYDWVVSGDQLISGYFIGQSDGIDDEFRLLSKELTLTNVA